MNFRSSYSLALLPVLLAGEAMAVDGKQASYDFGYAMQASGSCQGLLMRLDTEGKLEAKFGIKLRGATAPYGDAYTDGLIQAHRDDGNGLCKKAWDWYGCSGTKHPRLLVENPNYHDRPKICPY